MIKHMKKINWEKVIDVAIFIVAVAVGITIFTFAFAFSKAIIESVF